MTNLGWKYITFYKKEKYYSRAFSLTPWGSINRSGHKVVTQYVTDSFWAVSLLPQLDSRMEVICTPLLLWCLMLLLLSCFSRVRLCATPEMAAHQAPPSLGFQARTLEWVAISFSNAWKWKVKVKSFSRVWLSDPMDFSPPGSSVHGTSQARVLEWGAIAFSEIVCRGYF